MSTRLLLCLSLFGFVCTGCEQAKIREYSAPNDREPDPEKPKGPDRLLGAIIHVEDELHFFKLTGDSKAIDEHKPQFLELIDHLTFEPSIRWKVPEGWTEQLPSQDEMGFATTRITREVKGKTFSISASSLGIPDGSPADRFIMNNLNRWRNQIGLGSVPMDRLTSGLELRPIADGRLVMVVDYAGFLRKMPQALPESDSKLEYVKPANWTPGTLSNFRKAAFEVREGKDVAELTVSSLSAAVNPIFDNLNRWRGLVGLKAWETEDEAKFKELTISGKKARVVEFHGQDKVGNPTSLLGAIVVVGEEAWFIKLQGATSLVKKERDNYDAFLASLKIPE